MYIYLGALTVLLALANHTTLASSVPEQEGDLQKRPVSPPCNHECPLWARQMHCQDLYMPNNDQSLPFRNRILHPDCPLSCQACSVESEGNIDEMVAQYHTHCRDLQTPGTENVWKAGDAEIMYERILSQFDAAYEPTVLSREPWIVRLENIATPDEARVLVEQTRLEVARGEADAYKEGENEEGGTCHSTQAWCTEQCLEQPEVHSLIRKVESLVDMPFRYAEPIHLIEYVPGQKYGKHHDYNHDEAESMLGPRLFTILLYLNDIEDELGGETCFPDVDVCIQPKRGRAVIFANVRSDQPTVMENRTFHEAFEIEKGYKNAVTFWYHLRDYQHAAKWGCLSTDEEDIREDILDAMGYYDDDDDYEEDSDDYSGGEGEENGENEDENDYDDDGYDDGDYDDDYDDEYE